MDKNDLEETDHGPFLVLRPWSRGLCKLLAKQHDVKLPKAPAKFSLSQSDVYQSLVGCRNDASKEQHSKRQAEKPKEQSSGLFGGAESEAALVSVTGSSPRKATKTRLSRFASKEARAEKNVLKVAWMEKEIRALGGGHVTDVPKIHLDDMALFFEATESAVLTAESFQSRARQSFPKGTAAKETNRENRPRPQGSTQRRREKVLACAKVRGQGPAQGAPAAAGG